MNCLWLAVENWNMHEETMKIKCIVINCTYVLMYIAVRNAKYIFRWQQKWRGRERVQIVLLWWNTCAWKTICKIIIKPSDCIDRYLGCVGEHMKELKPFGDVPHKLSIQLKRSFVATRTFSQALNVASDVVTNMVKVRYLNFYII